VFGWGKDVGCEFIQSGFGFLMAVCPVAVALPTQFRLAGALS